MFMRAALGNSIGVSPAFFDIQWRHHTRLNAGQLENYGTNGTYQFNNGTGYYIGSFRPLSIMISDSKWQLVEGLIVDTKRGGIGFRNHTVPPESTYGTTWTEDILFIEPQTECVDLNVTLQFTTADAGDKIKIVNLVDKGGYSQLDKNARWWDSGAQTSQTDPWLAKRAYNAAWYYNALHMSVLNITRPSFLNLSTTGEPIPLPYIDNSKGPSYILQDVANRNIFMDSTGDLPKIGKLSMFDRGLGSILLSYLDEGNSSVMIGSVSKNEPYYKNPYRITQDHYELIGMSSVIQEEW
jgi:hypothetical protein